MAPLPNTFVSTDAVGNREQLSDVVERIDPEETPIWSMMSKPSARGTFLEYEIDTLDTPAQNVQEEGDEFDFDAVTPPVRVGSYSQISRKTWVLSDTQEAMDNAGQVEKRRYQQLKKGVEIRKDTEYGIVLNNASVAGTTREFAGIPAWCETNVDRGAGGADGGWNSGTSVTDAATDGAQRAFTKALLDTVHQQTFDSGGQPTHCFVSTYNKGVFVTFMSDANVASFRYAATEGQNTIIATADVYEGPFGKLMVMPNRVMATDATVARNVFVLDMGQWDFPYVRPIANVPNLAKTGDATKGVVLGEGTMRSTNEAASGIVADVFGIDATT